MIRIRGLSGVTAEFRSANSRVVREVKALTETSGRLIEGEAVSRVPVDTGKLRQSITYEPTKNGMGAMVTANAPYAAYVEFGTGGSVSIPSGWEDVAASFRGSGARTFSMPAQPYLIPAFLSQKDKYEQAIDKLIRSL